MFITLFLTQIVVLYLFCTSHSYRKQERKLRPCTFTFVLLFCELVTRNFACSTARLNDGSGCEPKIRPTCFFPMPVCFFVFNQGKISHVDDDGSGCPIDNSMRR